TMLGHLRHPFTRRAVLLEHGCEKTHNDAVRRWLAERGEATERFGYASVQLDGGIEQVRRRVAAWFEHELGREGAPEPATAAAADLRLAVLSSGAIDADHAALLASLCAGAVAAGGTVVVPDNDALLREPTFASALFAADARPTLAYGQFAERPGLHVMRAPTTDRSETVTGLGGAGVELLVALVAGPSIQGHPMIPTLQVGGADDSDLREVTAATLSDRIADTLSRRYQPKLRANGSARFQLTRGDLGVSL
ncbi:MAG: altronate hydrolase, partial [Planctomycetes bacterium]|nr:altronate hydrolase [Planctomycetota bacterium]